MLATCLEVYSAGPLIVGAISRLRPACSLTAAPAVANAITFALVVIARRGCPTLGFGAFTGGTAPKKTQ